MIFYCALSIGRVFSATIKTCPNVHQVHHVVLTIEMSINMQNNEQTEIEKINISITGGNFEAINGGTEAVLVDDKEIIGDIISGGTFKGTLDKSLIAPGVDFAVNPDGSIGVGADIVKDESSNPSYDDDEDLPPFIPTQPKDSGDDVTIVACAAAAVVAAIMAVFLIVS